MKIMTMRERMMAVILGQEHDRVPFAMYEIMLPKQEAFDLLGRGRIGIIRFCSITRAEHPFLSCSSCISCLSPICSGKE